MKIKQPKINYITQYETLRNFFNEYAINSGYVDNRKRENVIIKHAFCVASTELTKLSLAAIGSIVDKDHATVLHAKKNHEDNLVFLPSYKEVYNAMYKGLINTLETDGDVNDINLITSEKELRSRLVETSRRLRYKIKEINSLHKHIKDHPHEAVQENKALKKINRQLYERNKILEKELARVKNLL